MLKRNNRRYFILTFLFISFFLEESTNFDISFQSRVSPSFAHVEGRKDLHRFTLAFWMRTSDTENVGTPISYAAQHRGKLDDNALVLTDYTNFNLVINNETQSLEFDGNDGEWHHIAVTWQSADGIWMAYKDGQKIATYVLLALHIPLLFKHAFLIYLLI